MSPPARGSLLVAAPSLTDPNFYRSVVLVLASDSDGALGVVLNRPSETPVAEIVPGWSVHVSPPGVLFSGGPVQQNAAICVGRPAPGEAVTTSELIEELDGLSDEDLAGYSPLTPAMGTVDLHREPEEVEVDFAGLRVFKGYAGWGPGQLEEEIEEKAWVVVDGGPDDVLTSDPLLLWEQVLKRQGGWLAVLARHPADPSMN